MEYTQVDLLKIDTNHGIMILPVQNASLLTLSCHHFVMHYTGNPWLADQMFLRAA